MKKRKILVIPVLNMAYMLKGKPQDISDFFPELPDKELTKEEQWEFRKKIENKKFKDGRTYKNCFSVNKSKFNQIARGHGGGHTCMVWHGLDNTTVNEVAEAVEMIIDSNIYKDYEIWLLYITKDHEKFNDVRPIVERLEDKIDDVMVYTDNLEYTSAERQKREKLGFETTTKLYDYIEERIADEKSHFELSFCFIPYYQYFGAEFIDYGDISYVVHDVTSIPYYRNAPNFERRRLPISYDFEK